MPHQFCDLCGHRTNNERYCSTCENDPYRKSIIRIHEILGVSDYTIRNERELKANLAEATTLLKVLYDAHVKCHIVLEGDFDIHGWGDRLTAFLDKMGELK